MQATTTRFGAVLAAMTLSSGAVFAAGQDAIPGAASPSPHTPLQQGETRTFEGRLVTLFEYLSYGAGTLETSRPGLSQPATTDSTPSSDSAPGPIPTPAPTPGSTANPADADRSRDLEPGNQPGNPLLLSAPDRTAEQSQVADPNQNPRTDSFRAGDAAPESPSRVGTVTIASGGGGGQPLILLAPRSTLMRDGSPGGLAVSPQTRTDLTQPARYPTQRELLEQGQVRDRTSRTAGQAIESTPGGSEAYILVFNPQNYASRLALSQAQALASQVGSESGPTPGESEADRLQVRGDEADASQPASGRDQWSKPSPMKSGSHVKVTGKVLNRGGLQAIEVMSVEPATQAGP